MSRLFYEPGVRAAAPSTSTRLAEPATDLERTDGAVATYFEKITKLIPAEVLTAYVAMVGFLPSINDEQSRVLIGQALTVLCAALTPIYLQLLADSDKPHRIHLCLSTISFVVWAYATAGNTVVPQHHDSAAASIALIATTLLIGLVPLKT